MFVCKTCQYSEPAKTACVHRRKLQNTIGETAGVTQDLGNDPTVGTHLNRAIFSSEDEIMSDFSSYSCCTLCGEEIMCTQCGYGLVSEEEQNMEGFEFSGGDDYTGNERAMQGVLSKL